MTQEEIKAKLALTDEQQVLVAKFNTLLKEMEKNNIGIVYDSCIDCMGFAAFNAEEVLDMNNLGYTQDDDEAVDVDNSISWGNLEFGKLYEFNSHYSNLYAVFGCKTTLNESMMSAAL